MLKFHMVWAVWKPHASLTAGTFLLYTFAGLHIRKNQTETLRHSVALRASDLAPST